MTDYEKDEQGIPIQVGDRVRLVSLSGPVMIVEDIKSTRTEILATCVWPGADGKKMSEVYSTTSLFRWWFFSQRMGESWAWWEKNGPGLDDWRLYSRGTSAEPPAPPITFNFGTDGSYFHEPPADPLANLSEMRKATSN